MSFPRSTFLAINSLFKKISPSILLYCDCLTATKKFCHQSYSRHVIKALVLLGIRVKISNKMQNFKNVLTELLFFFDLLYQWLKHSLASVLTHDHPILDKAG